MQLLIILALLLYGGKNGAQGILEEVKPVLENIGGEQMREALKSAEEISGVLSAVQALSSQNAPAANPAPHASENTPAEAFPLAPICTLADKNIVNSLTNYISAN